jgi:hypothetical protein
MEGIEAAHGSEKPGGGFARVVARGEDFEGGELGRSGGAGPGEEADATGTLPGIALGDAGEEAQGGAGRVVAGELPGRLDGRTGSRDDWGVCGELLGGDGAGAQEMQNAVARGDHGGFHSEGTGAAIEDKRDAPFQFFKDVGGGCGGDAAETIGAGSGDGFAKAIKDGPKKRMGTHPDGDGGEAGGDNIGDDGTPGQDKGEWAGPETEKTADERIGCDGGEAVEPFELGKMDNEGIEEGTLFGFENTGGGLRVESVAGKAIDGFGGEGNEFAASKKRGSSRDAGGTVE